MQGQSLFKQYTALLEFLRDNQLCWEHEVLHSYPQCLERIPKNWLLALEKLTPEQLWLMDSKQSFAAIEVKELAQIFTKLEQLTQIPQKIVPTKNIEIDQAAAFYGVRGKKRHEIETLAPLIRELYQERGFKNLVDVGGGQGHLARVLAKHYGVEAISLDADERLQALGEINLKRLAHRGPGPLDANLKFENCKITAATTPACFTKDSFVLGLHTCGDLAVDLMAHAHKANCHGILSFGCCYSKMATDKDGFAFNGPKNLPLNSHALTLATRGHKSDTRKDFELKLLVKRHRYTLHLFHYHERGIKRFIPMGETVAKEYRGKFSEYAHPRLQAHGIDVTKEELDIFFESDFVKTEFKKMISANLIRWQFGRALELVILFERAMQLENKGMNVEVASYFDEHLSPRNIGILAYT